MDYFDSRDFLNDDSLPSDESVISQFFDGTTVFLTGSTGFIGSLILEKLLRCCPGIKQVFLLLRIKKGKSEEERFNDLFRNDIFYKLWKTNPEFGKKVKLIPGDCSLPQLGISDKDRETLLDVNIIFHGAADLKFDGHLRQSFQTNVCATQDLLNLAKKMKHFKGFTYISTAFLQVSETTLIEQFYKPTFGYNEVKTIVDTCSDEEITQLMPLLLDRTTTYSFTKCIAEEIIEGYKGDIPIGVVRPSIVTNTCTDPLKGWISTINGHVAITLGLLLGFLRVLKMNGNNEVDTIPGDKVASATIACTWDYATNKPPSPIYNVTNSQKCQRLSWSVMKKYAMHTVEVRNLASRYSVWEPISFFVTSSLLYRLLVILLHVIPGFFCDLLLTYLTDKKIRVLNLYRKATYLWHVMDVYIESALDCDDKNLYTVWDKMKSNDKRIFNFSMIDFNWDEYVYYFIPGVQSYIIKEIHDCESIRKARRQRIILKVSHYVLTSLLVILLVSVISNIIKKVF